MEKLDQLGYDIDEVKAQLSADAAERLDAFLADKHVFSTPSRKHIDGEFKGYEKHCIYEADLLEFLAQEGLPFSGGNIAQTQGGQ